MPKYRFHWISGDVNEGEETTVADAFTHLGYGAGAARALDYHEEIKEVPKIIPKNSLKTRDPLIRVLYIRLLQKKVSEDLKFKGWGIFNSRDENLADKIIRKLEELL